MARLPVIVGFGGFNAAGRSSFHQGYRRTVLDSLSQSDRQETLAGLAVMMQRVKPEELANLSPEQIEQRFGEDIRQHTLIRKIAPEYFDVDRVPTQQKVTLDAGEHEDIRFALAKRNLPENIPDNWHVSPLDNKTVRVVVSGPGSHSVLVDSCYRSPVQCAGQLPGGFDPAELYASRFHPKGLQLAVVGASDALNSMGLDWGLVNQHVSADEIGAYSSSVMSQLDPHGIGGLLQSRLQGGRVSTKNLALGLGSMTADFVNAYVLGNLGSTASIAGACASFLYNLRAGIEDIQSGRRRVVVVGSSEAPILPEVIDGYSTMGALATSDKLAKLSNGAVDLRRASRPFGDNCGFVIAESTQHVVLMDDELAVTLGADIHAAVPDVFINADGFKKSISAPGPGNYLTMAKAVASASSLLGESALRQRSFVQAHGSSTPQNRVTEADILNRVASAFGIQSWPVTAVKAYVGHSLAPASGDQLMNSLGVFSHGILPGLKTTDRIADDVDQSHLQFSLADKQLEQAMDCAFLNSKGFGGNNATACVLAPHIVDKMLHKRYGEKAMSAYFKRREQVRADARAYHQSFLAGDYRVAYRFGENMLDENDIDISAEQIKISGCKMSIDLTKENLYKDML